MEKTKLILSCLFHLMSFDFGLFCFSKARPEVSREVSSQDIIRVAAKVGEYAKSFNLSLIF